MFRAYNHHQHLRLNPNDIWLTIDQGVSHHINYSAEKFHKKFVQHEEKEDVKINAGDILDLILLKNTIEVIVILGCGVPKVTLEVTLEDWIKLQKNDIKKLKFRIRLLAGSS
ncbi:35444_t:CDS:2 [Racocetra persica]|uniref:35444_t:CDS:1 n=1 Tax=Racocetra persica TaxID=160502 RepID=A0ACA9PWP3_9GLOM|nr:35444_t:CDS:2 [Racocetra persica]